MDSGYDSKKQVFSGIKTGCISIIAGSIVAIPLMAMIMDTDTLQPTGEQGIFFLLCIYGAIFNILPYVGAGIISEIYELPIKGIAVMGLVGMGVSIFIGDYYLDIFPNWAELNGFYNLTQSLIYSLTYCAAYFLPYYISFLFFNLIKRTRKDFE